MNFELLYQGEPQECQELDPKLIIITFVQISFLRVFPQLPDSQNCHAAHPDQFLSTGSGDECKSFRRESRSMPDSFRWNRVGNRLLIIYRR